MKKGIHPMRQMVRIVLGNGASFTIPQVWQEPLSATLARGPGGATAVVRTKFLQIDETNAEYVTGKPSRAGQGKMGRREKFENKFAADAEAK